MFVVLYRVCTHVILDIMTMSVCVHVCVVVEGMNTFKTKSLDNERFCFCLCCYRGYVHM